MTDNPVRILCVGKDSGLLRSRSAILENAGYEIETVMYTDAESLLMTAAFDLVILSAILGDEEKNHIASIVGWERILTLPKLIFASELLAQVAERLQNASHHSVA